MKKLTIAAAVLFALTSNFVHADGTKKPDPYKTSFEQQTIQSPSIRPATFSEMISDFSLRD